MLHPPVPSSDADADSPWWTAWFVLLTEVLGVAALVAVGWLLLHVFLGH